MRIVVVEDDAAMRTQFEKVMTQLGQQVFTAEDGRQALKIIDDHEIDAILAKRLMPEPNGIELCCKIKAMNLSEPIYFILVVDRDSRFDFSQVAECRADDILSVPLNAQELRIKLDLAGRIVRLERELNQNFKTHQRNYQQTIHALSRLIDAYNEQIGQHCRRVGKLALSIAKRHPDVRPEDHPLIEAAGLLHDIGLIGLPENILKKRRTAMTGEEMVFFRSHSERGEQILAQMDLLKPLSRIVRMHHEQYNGRGFPDGLSNEQVPLAARLIAAASLYDDLAHREGIEPRKVPESLQQVRGYQLEPILVDLLLEIHLIRVQEEAGRNELTVAVTGLEPGMILAADVVMKSGAFVAAAGTALDTNIIQKLKRYLESGNIMDKVFIRKS